MVTTRRGSQRQVITSVPQAATPSTSQRGRGRGSARGRGRGRSAAAVAIADPDTEQPKLIESEPQQEHESQDPLAGKTAYTEPVIQDTATDASHQDGASNAAGYPIAGADASLPVENVLGSGIEHLNSTEEGRMSKVSWKETGGNEISRKETGVEEGDDVAGSGEKGGVQGRGAGESGGEESSGEDSSGEDSSGEESSGEDSMGEESSGEESSEEGSRGKEGRITDVQDEGPCVSDDDDDAIFGSNIMGQLASSLKAALKARAGLREFSPPPPHSGSTDKKLLTLTSDPASIRWKPEVEQPKTVQAAATTRPVSGVKVDKEKGLQHQLLVPPRVKSTEHAPSSETKRWFELPATKITDEVKQELRLLRLRGAYDPKRFYKSFDETKFPKHFQIGTVLDNPQDFYSSRLTARERGSSITEELLADAAVAAARKKRYNKLQEEATRYQKVKKRKTDLARTNPKPKRPKH